MHLKRWITGLAALPFLIWLISKGGTVIFGVVISVVSVIALLEYFKIVLYPQNGKHIASVSASAYFMGIIIIWAVYYNLFDIVPALIVLNLIVSGFISLNKFRKDQSAPWMVAKQLMGLVYIPLFLSYLIQIRNSSEGIQWIYFLLVIVFAGDIIALYVGSYLGRHKLCPSISPGKTIEGSIGGLAANLLAGGIFKYFCFPLYSWQMSILFFILVGVAGQLGDLFESELKRSAGVKDSGGLLPGHGGILDRIDALIFAAPVAWFFKEYLL
jgi:phosphatidate cytidylyltransferase